VRTPSPSRPLYGRHFFFLLDRNARQFCVFGSPRTPPLFLCLSLSLPTNCLFSLTFSSFYAPLPLFLRPFRNVFLTRSLSYASQLHLDILSPPPCVVAYAPRPFFFEFFARDLAEPRASSPLSPLRRSPLPLLFPPPFVVASFSKVFARSGPKFRRRFCSFFFLGWRVLATQTRAKKSPPKRPGRLSLPPPQDWLFFTYPIERSSWPRHSASSFLAWRTFFFHGPSWLSRRLRPCSTYPPVIPLPFLLGRSLSIRPLVTSPRAHQGDFSSLSISLPLG